MLKFQNELRRVMMDFLKRENYYKNKNINNWIECRVLLTVLRKDNLTLDDIMKDLEKKFSSEELENYMSGLYRRDMERNPAMSSEVKPVILMLRKLGLNNEERRAAYKEKVNELYDLFIKMCNGDQSAYEEFIIKNKDYAFDKNGGKRRKYLSLGVLLLLIEDRNNGLGRDIWFDTRNIPFMKVKFLISDIKNELGYEMGAKKRRQDTSELIDNVKLIVEETSDEDEDDEGEEKIETIESLRLERDQYRSSLKLIEKNMDDLLERIKEETENIANEQIRDFFVSLNSGKYGNFLDKMPLTEETLKDIRRNNLDRDLPQEVKRVLIFIKAVIKFINDQGITPIRPINEVFEGTAEDIAKMDYSGSPFIGNEKKELKIVASGYKYKDMVISIPKVEEVE